MSDTILRAARKGEGAILFNITAASVQGLGAAHYSPAQLAGWMGARSDASYEAIIALGNVTVTERAGNIFGFCRRLRGGGDAAFYPAKRGGSGSWCQTAFDWHGAGKRPPHWPGSCGINAQCGSFLRQARISAPKSRAVFAW